MQYLALTELLAIHERIVETIGGSTGVRDIGLIQAAVEKPKTKLFGVEMYQHIHEKAAVLLEAIANYHGFVDGNKRSAFVACGYFLHINGYALEVEQDKVVQFMRRVATKKEDIPKIASWLKRHAKRLS